MNSGWCKILGDPFILVWPFKLFRCTLPGVKSRCVCFRRGISPAPFAWAADVSQSLRAHLLFTLLSPAVRRWHGWQRNMYTRRQLH